MPTQADAGGGSAMVVVVCLLRVLCVVDESEVAGQNTVDRQHTSNNKRKCVISTSNGASSNSASYIYTSTYTHTQTQGATHHPPAAPPPPPPCRGAMALFFLVLSDTQSYTQ